MSNPDKELEDRVLRESLVSATGLRSENIQIGLKGDPSLRQTVFSRDKHNGPIDQVFECLEPNLEEMMINRSPYRLYIGFNSGEIRTCSIFDPMREEVHVAKNLCDADYVERHFPRIGYDTKVQAIRDNYRDLRASDVFRYVPDYWKNIMDKRDESWEPINKDHLPTIIRTLKKLRDLEEYYLRNVTVCIVQHLVRLNFNCDGTQMVDAANYDKFLAENLDDADAAPR